MFYKGHFSKNTPKETILKEVKKEGFDPIVVNDPPGFIYHSHHHKETKLLVCLEGSMQVIVKDQKYDFEPGDKLIIPGLTQHSAVVGKKGCTFYWSEIIKD